MKCTALHNWKQISVAMQYQTTGTTRPFQKLGRPYGKFAWRKQVQDTDIPIHMKQTNWSWNKVRKGGEQNPVEDLCPQSDLSHKIIKVSQRVTEWCQHGVYMLFYCIRTSNNISAKELTSFLTLGIARFSAFLIPRVVNSRREVCHIKFWSSYTTYLLSQTVNR